MVPHLSTALTGPILALEQHILDAMSDIEHWLRLKWQQQHAPFYASVDLRNAGFKLAPVDTNLFPGGFNNLSQDCLPLCVQAAMSALEKICPSAQRLILIPEKHTRNTYYLQNLAALAAILRQAGIKVRIGSIAEEIVTPTLLPLPQGGTLLLQPVRRHGKRLLVGDFDPCVVLLNNDLSGGIPDVLQGLEQVVIPPLHGGWVVRRKSRHFAAYARVAREFAERIGIDPWLITPYYAICGPVNFQARVGEECLAAQVADVLARIRAKYREYGVTDDPFVIAKADAGTYGMGIMTVKSPDEVIALNRRQRTKMAVVKEGLQVQQVIIQEGVYTFENIHEAVAEPVVYMIDHYVVGGFYRVHTKRGKDENLNAPGMHFVPLAFETACSLPDCNGKPDIAPNRFYAYGVIARLALLAASLELADTQP